MPGALIVAVVLGGALLAGCGGGEFKSTPDTGNGGTGNAGAGGSDGSAAGGAGGKSSSTAGSPATGGLPSGGGGGVSPSGGVPVSGGDTSTGGTAEAGSGGSGSGGEPPSECPCEAPRPSCVAGRCISLGPPMVRVAAGAFYVDSTEVTVAQYGAFLKATGDDTSEQTAECAWNSTFEPASAAGDPAPLPELPVTRVDHCDAAAYCAWADKRLCGKIGGGPISFADLAAPGKSQWFAACGGPLAQPYPYGVTHQNGTCNDDAPGASLAKPGSFEDCEGFPRGLFDMVGNVSEWVDACDANAGASDGCETIGGSYLDSGTCTLSSLKHRNEASANVGFRCCSQ